MIALLIPLKAAPFQVLTPQDNLDSSELAPVCWEILALRGETAADIVYCRIETY